MAGNGFGDMFGGIMQSHVDPRLSDLYQAIGGLGESIEALIEETGVEVAEDTYAYWRQSGNTGAAGTDVQLTLNPGVVGTSALLTNLAFTGGVGGPCAVYIDGVSPGNLVHFIANAQIGSNYGVDLYVPAGRPLIFHFYLQPNNQVCTITAVLKQLTHAPTVEVEGQ